MKRLFFTFLFMMASPTFAGIVDQSSTIFFPPQMKDTLTVSQSFPLFWWNFLILESQGEPNWLEAETFCTQLKSISSDLIEKVECKQDLKSFQPLVKEWAQDLWVRESKPNDLEILRTFRRVLAQASLPTGDASLIALFRQDPFEAWKELKSIAENKMPLRLERKNGFMFDQASHKIIIPIQVHFPPNQTHQTEELKTQIYQNQNPAWVWIGPHASTLKNENQIKSDMHVVSLIGIAVLLFSILALIWMKRWRLALLYPIVFLGTGVSTLITIFVFGSIHGLSLSFGTGIIGLALDYGFQGAFNMKAPSIWKSNFCGLLTTLMGLIVLMTSDVPLLRQMMFFSVVGIGVSFALLYLFARQFPNQMEAKPFAIHFGPSRMKLALTLVLFAATAWGLLTIRPNLDMQQFDFQDAPTKRISQWLFQSSGLKPPIFEVHRSADLQKSIDELQWATDHHIAVENLAHYFPNESIQKQNLLSWTSAWPALQKKLDATENKFFEPFLSETPSALPSLKRTYSQHLESEGRWITLWLPKTETEESQIKAEFPNVNSLRALVSSFPKMLSLELSWMTPLSLLLATLVHLIYYRRLSLAVIALIPFFTGMGLLSLAKILFHLDISFISVMGMVMVFGFSLDYGIFATDASLAQINKGSDQRLHPASDGFWTGILFAAIATLAGFLPLMFCTHPVLKHLGQTLFFGSLGTLIGAIFGVPSLIALTRKTSA